MEEVRTLLDEGREQGYLSAEHILEVLADVDLTPEQIDDVYVAFHDLGIDVVGADGVHHTHSGAHGNGEQALNAQPAVQAGAALLVDNADLTADWVRREVPALLRDTQRLAAMSEAGAGIGHRDAADIVAAAALELAGARRGRGGRA